MAFTAPTFVVIRYERLRGASGAPEELAYSNMEIYIMNSIMGI